MHVGARVSCQNCAAPCPPGRPRRVRQDGGVGGDQQVRQRGGHPGGRRAQDDAVVNVIGISSSVAYLATRVLLYGPSFVFIKECKTPHECYIKYISSQTKSITFIVPRYIKWSSVVSSLVCVELPLRELDLLSGFEGGHPEVGAARASERVAKVTLQKHIGILRVH